MGTAEELPKEPVKKTVFLEDMSESELVSAVSIYLPLTPLLLLITGQANALYFFLLLRWILQLGLKI